MRICYLVSYFYPHASGAERQAFAQGIELARRGHLVHVLTHKVPVEPRDEIVQGIHIHRWIRSIHLGPLFGISFVLSAARALERLADSFDVVHAHQGLWEAVASGLARRRLKEKPTLVQPASSGAFGEAQQLCQTKGFDRLRTIILRNTAFAAISQGVEKEWLDLGVPAERMVRMASGVDAFHFRPGESSLENDLPPGPRVVFTGRLHPQKNLEVLLEAWPAVAKATGATLLLVGHGPERRKLEMLAESRRITDCVRFCGSVFDPAEHLRASDVFVLPSVAEGMSNSLLEAMASALPCVVSRIGGNVDLVEDGVTGLLADPIDVSDWCEKILLLLKDRELARRLGSSARALVEETYDMRVVVSRYELLYERLLAGGPIAELSLARNRWPGASSPRV